MLSRLFKKNRGSAPQARERLQILLAHERAGSQGADFLPQLQRELIEVVKKYVNIEDEQVKVELERGGDVSTLEVNIEIPEEEKEAAKRARAGVEA